LRDAELLARAVVDVHDGAPETDALASYHQCRDTLSTELFDVVDVIAGHAWGDDEIGGLLLRLSAAMNDEVEMLAALPAWPPSHRLRAVS
jgi:hypothetical protein